MKLSITIGIIVVSSLLGWIGSLMDKGNWFGGWSIILTTIGAFIGLWLGYKIGKSYF